MAVQLHGVAVQHPNSGAQLLQNVQQQRHVADLGNVFNAADAVYQQGGGNNADGGVFGAADGDLAEQRMAAANNILVHKSPFHEVYRAGRSRPSVSRCQKKQGTVIHLYKE